MNNRKWSRIIAMLLAVMLVFCDSNVIYAVESMTEAQTEDPAAAQAAADAEAADTEAVEADAAEGDDEYSDFGDTDFTVKVYFEKLVVE